MKSLNTTKKNHSIWILSILMLSGLLGRVEISLAAEGTWTYKSDVPTARTWVGGCVLDGRIYVIGGATSTSSVTSAVEVYDPTADTWTRMADMPSARCAHATCLLDGKIYVFGGISPGVFSTAKKNVYVYDPQTDTWAQKADMPYANAHCAVAVTDGMIYLIGGMLSVSSPPVPTVMAYDPITESWTQKTDMPTPRGLLSACVVDGKIYAIGGATENWGVFCYKHVEVYDPSMNTWTRKSDMPTERFSLGTCVVDGKIYAIGGHLRNDACRANEVYDPGTDTWTAETPMQHKRLGHFLGLIGDKIYAIGGSFPNPAPTVISKVEEYDTGLGVPVPDFNSDGIIDIQDLLILIESWGQDNPLCDIAPAPFGDGIVDALDLELFMSYWGQEVDDPTLIAHWALDEEDGTVAYDSAGVNDAFVMGGTTWLPSGGQVNGALQLDGVDGCVVAEQAFNPAIGPFSIFAWIKGGAPGQVVVSQQGAADWLMVNAEGHLMTDLKATGRSGGPLQSQTIITDGFWHRIGFAWDGANRILYVDDVQVAENTQDGPEGSNSGLYIGTSKTMEPGTYFSGLIDDIRIYNRAVHP
ncbi:kelch repeat-containing protein [Planctomycetota bacterium]